MIGFSAEYSAGTIQIDGKEIEEAGWFHQARSQGGGEGEDDYGKS